jgi:mono/diheme cytochrome c family protein
VVSRRDRRPSPLLRSAAASGGAALAKAANVGDRSASARSDSRDSHLARARSQAGLRVVLPRRRATRARRDPLALSRESAGSPAKTTMNLRIVHLLTVSVLSSSLCLAACDSGKKDEAPADAAKPDEVASSGETKPDEKPDEVPKTTADPDASDEAKPDEPEPMASSGEAEDSGDEATPEDPEPEPAPEPAPAKDEPKKKATKKKPADDAASKIDAKALYLAKCKSCHGADGKGKTKFAEKHEVEDLTKSKASVTKIAKAIREGVPDTKMKSFKTKLSEDEIKAVAAYVKKL